MLKIIPELSYVPNLSPQEKQTINNLQNHFSSTAYEGHDITMYVHPDTINANINLVLEARLHDDAGNTFYQLWLIDVLNANNSDEISTGAHQLYNFKNQLILNKTFDMVEYPANCYDDYKLSVRAERLTLKQRFAINTLLVVDRSQLDEDDQGQPIEDLSDDKYNYIKYAHSVWLDEMTDENQIFTNVMQLRKNPYTALNQQEYDIANYFIGFNFANQNIKANTDKIRQDSYLSSIVNNPSKRLAVKGLAKTGKTTLLVLRALRAIRTKESLTITSFTYSNLARIRLMLQSLLNSDASLQTSGVRFRTVASILLDRSPLETEGLYIDNAEDISGDGLQVLLEIDNFNDIFIAYNPTQQVIFNKAQGSSNDEHWPLSDDVIKKGFTIIPTTHMLNSSMSSIKTIYRDFLESDVTESGLVLGRMPGNDKHPSVFIHDGVNETSPILTADELSFIQKIIDAKYQISPDDSNRFLANESQKVTIVCPLFNPLVQVSMFLDEVEKDKKQGRSFLTYKEIISRLGSDTQKFNMNSQNNFIELNNFLFRQAQNDKNTVTDEADVETVRNYINNMRLDPNNPKAKRVRMEEHDLHRFLPAMTNRILLTTLESFKGLQSDILVAILPPEAKFKTGNYTTILSSAKKTLFIINRSEKFHDFIEEEKQRGRLRHNERYGLLGF